MKYGSVKYGEIILVSYILKWGDYSTEQRSFHIENKHYWLIYMIPISSTHLKINIFLHMDFVLILV